MYFSINGKDLITEPADPNRRRFGGGFAVGLETELSNYRKNRN